MSDYFAFQWHISDECDQRCKHCYIFSKSKEELHSMDFEDMERIVENACLMSRKANKIPYFSITGGDPILHPDFWNLLEILNEKNVMYSVMGNPFHLNKDVCSRLDDLNCRQYQLSLDGLRKTHDYFRMPGSYDSTLKSIKTLKQSGIKTSVMTTVSSLNINQIPYLVDVVVSNHVDLFSFARYCPTGVAENIISPDSYKNFLEKMWVKFNQYKYSNTLFNLKDHLWTLLLYEKGLFTIPEDLKDNVIYDGCGCANSHLTILPNGDVYACRRMESRVGNALESDLFDIFKSSEMDKYRQYDNFEKCGECELLRFCRGCPAVSYGYTNNMYSPDPQCWMSIKN